MSWSFKIKAINKTAAKAAVLSTVDVSCGYIPMPYVLSVIHPAIDILPDSDKHEVVVESNGHMQVDVMGAVVAGDLSGPTATLFVGLTPI